MPSLSRRKLLTTTAGALASGLLVPSGFSFATPLNLPIGLQLYTVETELNTDLDGTLQAVARIGYRQVQTASTPSRIKPAVLREALDRAG